MAYYGPLRDLPAKLWDQARAIDVLAKIPDHTTTADLVTASKALMDAYDGMNLLIKGELPGCTCQRIETEYSVRLDYDVKCTHHGTFVAQTQRLEKSYRDAAEKLTNELRIKFVAAALSSIASGTADVDVTARRALALANAAIAALVS